MADTLVHIVCPLCSENEYKNIYGYSCEAGTVLGSQQVKIVMCEICGFVFVNPRVSKDQINAHYKSASSGNTYHEGSAQSRKGVLINERVKFIENHLGQLESGKIIDIGCGQGQLLNALNMPRWIKYGLDPSLDRDTIQTTQFQLEKGYIEELKNINHDFDAIVCISSLEHFYNPNDVIKLFSEMLNKDGLLFLEVPDSLEPISQISEFYNFEHLSHFTEYTLSKMLGQNKLEILELTKNPSLSYLRLVARKVKDPVEIKIDDDRIDFVGKIMSYRLKRNLRIQEISDRIMSKLSKLCNGNKRIAVYGTGIHTNFLFENYNLNDSVSVFIDSNPAKWGTNHKSRQIYSPHDIEKLKICGILISSHDFEQEIFDTIAIHNVNNIPVIRCYQD